MTIEVTDLSCRYGPRLIFSDIGFRLERGNLLVVHGPNASGKTTLLRCLAGLFRADRGQVSIDLDQVVYLGHRSAVVGNMSVSDNLRFWARIYGRSRSEAENEARWVADTLDIAGQFDRPAAMLSAGQSRRLGIARVFLSQCLYWLLDEPTMALDDDGIARFTTVLERHLAAGGLAIVTSQRPDYGDTAQTLDLSDQGDISTFNLTDDPDTGWF